VIPYPDKDNPQRWYSFSAFPIFDDANRLVKILEAGREITELTTLQEDLRKLVEEKELLLRELHHRVKNNLNVVISLLSIQFGGLEDERIQKALRDTTDRISSMALVHKLLYQSRTQEYVNFRDFFSEFSKELTNSYAQLGMIQVVSRIDDVAFRMEKAIPVGLIVNELVTNALKYAFADGREGRIEFTVRETDPETVCISVADNGIGLSPGFDPAASQTLGMQLIHGLTGQIGGTVEIHQNHGTTFTITFPKE
jgi:two-component sensor histidine kinase